MYEHFQKYLYVYFKFIYIFGDFKTLYYLWNEGEITIVDLSEIVFLLYSGFFLRD